MAVLAHQGQGPMEKTLQEKICGRYRGTRINQDGRGQRRIDYMEQCMGQQRVNPKSLFLGGKGWTVNPPPR